MQKLAEICVRRPVFAIMLMMALVVAGLAAYSQLGVDRFPKLDLPTVYVSTLYPGASPEEVETEVSRVIEDVVGKVAGIDELRSISFDGNSFVIVTFNLNVDVDVGAQDIRDAISGVMNRLPPTIYPPVIRKSDTDASPILTLAVSGPREPRELYVLADRYVKEIVESADGVGDVLIAGSTERAVQINIEAKRLAAYKLSIMEVREALARQNAEVPGGRVDLGFREQGLRTLGRLEDPREFERLVVSSVNGSPIRIRDLGEVVDGTKEVRTICRLNGAPAVVVDVQRRSGANTIEVINSVKERLERCRELMPDDVKIELIRDQSRYIEASLHEIQRHLVVGSLLASIVVFMFMKSWRSTIIAALAIPTSIIATFAAMKWLDFTLNNVTMLALVLMVGIVIDDAIVVLENIFHCVEEKGMPPMEAAVKGTREIALAVMATTLSLVVVFLPVSFLQSVTGRLMYEFGVTASIAILISLVVSFSLTPMMCSRMLKPIAAGADGPASRRGFYHLIEVGYGWCLRLAMRFRWAVLVICVLIIASIPSLYGVIKQDYIPTNVDEGEFEVGVRAPEGVTTSSMAVTLNAVERELLKIPGVENALTTVGTRGFSSVNNASIYVQLKPANERIFSLERLWNETLAGQPMAAFEGNFSQREKMSEIRKRLSKYKDLMISVRNQTSLRQGAPVDIDFMITGPTLEDLADYADKLKEKVKKLPGLVDVQTTLMFEKPELLVRIDRDRSAALGVDVQEIAETLRIAVGGDDRVSRYRDATLDDVYDVELRLVGIDRGSREAISQLYVRTRPIEGVSEQGQAGMGMGMGMASASMVGNPSADGQSISRLDNLVTFSDRFTATRIDRMDRQRSVGVRANIEAGYSLTEQIDAVKKASEELNMPSGYFTSVRGRGRELERTIGELGWAFVLSFVFMYIILAAQFENFFHPITILLTLPLAVPFGLVSLWLGDETLNLYSALGVLVLFGVVKKAAILQVDHTNQLRAQGMERLPAIMRANRDRLRPILMTTIAFVAGMIPLLIGSGPGAEERRSIAVLAIGGQTLSLLLTLVAAPVAYSFLDDIGILIRGRRRQPASVPAAVLAPVSATTSAPNPMPVATSSPSQPPSQPQPQQESPALAPG